MGGKRSLIVIPDPPLSRRDAVKQVARWVALTGTVGTAAVLGDACGRTPLGLPFDLGGTGPTPTPTPSPTGSTPTPTPTFAPCTCTQVGATTSFTRSNIPVDHVGYDAGRNIFVCHDSNGFYSMTAICTHASCIIPSSGGCASNYNPNNLSQGFCCGCHGSHFDANGAVTQGPALSPLDHFQTYIDAAGTIWVNVLPPFVDPSCRCT